MPDSNDLRLAAARAAGLPDAWAARLVGDNAEALAADAASLADTLGALSAPPAATPAPPATPPAPSADGFDAGVMRDDVSVVVHDLEGARRLAVENPDAWNALVDAGQIDFARLASRGR